MGEYVINVAGPLTDEALAAFPTLRRTAVPRHTMLSGELPDQCALQGVLSELDRRGVEIIEVRRLPGHEHGDQRETGAGS